MRKVVLNNTSIGIMQGRFTDKAGLFLPQQFPNFWENEFKTCKENNISMIEWMYGESNLSREILLNEQCFDVLKHTMESTGVFVRSIIGNYFLVYPLFGNPIEAKINANKLAALMHAAEQIGADTIVIPLLELSSPGSGQEFTQVRESIEYAFDQSAASSLCVALEMDRNAKECIDFITTFSVNVGLCFDTGNAVDFGFDVKRDLPLIKDHIYELHLKDKNAEGESVMLGEGIFNFDLFFALFGCPPSCKRYILESFYRNALVDTKKNIEFIYKTIKLSEVYGNEHNGTI